MNLITFVVLIFRITLGSYFGLWAIKCMIVADRSGVKGESYRAAVYVAICLSALMLLAWFL